MPIVIKEINRDLNKDKSSKAQKKKKTYKGPLPKSKPRYANPKHPMNTERTGPSVMKMDPEYKSHGGMVYKGR